MRRCSHTALDDLFSPHHQCTVMSTPRMERLAREVVASVPETLAYSAIDWKDFPDGTPNLKLKVEDIQGRDVLFIIDIDMQRLLPLLSALYAIPRYLARTLN